MSIEHNKSLVHRFFTQMCNERRLDLAASLFSADHAYHDPSIPGVPPGPDGMKAVLGPYHAGIPDSHWGIEAMVAEGDLVVTRWLGTGTHHGTLNGIPATGRRVRVEGVWTHRIAGERIVESWNVWDTLGMLKSLGVIPG